MSNVIQLSDRRRGDGPPGSLHTIAVSKGQSRVLLTFEDVEVQLTPSEAKQLADLLTVMAIGVEAQQ